MPTVFLEFHQTCLFFFKKRKKIYIHFLKAKVVDQGRTGMPKEITLYWVVAFCVADSICKELLSLGSVF